MVMRTSLVLLLTAKFSNCGLEKPMQGLYEYSNMSPPSTVHLGSLVGDAREFKLISPLLSDMIHLGNKNTSFKE